MENWHQCLFLAKSGSLSNRFLTLIAGLVVMTCINNPAIAAETEIVDPLGTTGAHSEDVGLIKTAPRREIKLAGIDTENFELGIAGGLLSVEDFETNALVVASLTYHVSEDFFVEARYGQTEVGETSFDKLSGGASLLSAEDRDLQFYDLSLGINVFPGEAFILNRWAVNSSFYLVGGVGSTNFAGNEEFTINAGVGYRILANDFLSLNFHVRDHVFETEITGDKKTTHNFEVSAGISIFF